MIRQVSHNGRGAFIVRFAYDRRLVDLVKSLPNRRWLATEKSWQVPDSDVVSLVDLLHPEGFSFDDAVRRLYHACGGLLLLETERTMSARGPRDLFSSIDTEEAVGPRPGDYTVGRLNREVCALLEGAFPAPIWIVGEISGFNKTAHRRIAGFQLIEREPDGREASKVNATLFDDARREIERRLAVAGNPFRLEDEVAIRALVRVDLYEPWGQYRVCVEDIDVHYTLGEAARRREEIVRSLTQQGLITLNTSLPFPPLPLRVGLVTSLGSDAFNDVLRTFHESGFSFDVTVHGARVQGRSTESSVLNALDWFRDRAASFDVVMICRGGGSRTDLAWFDSEALGRAVATFPLPVVVGIGHEQDLSVLDFVGLRCKTPTAAAAYLVEKVSAALRRLEEQGSAILEIAARAIEDERRAGGERARRLVRATRALLDLESAELRQKRERTSRGALAMLSAARRELGRQALSIPRVAARRLEGSRAVLEQLVRQVVQGARRDLASSARHLAEMSTLLGPKSRRRLALDVERIEARARRLFLVDPRRVVERGYAILRVPGGDVVTDAATAPAGTTIRAELRRGTLQLRSEGPERANEGGS